METKKDIISYTHFKNAIKMGLTVGVNDLPFEKALIFSLIEEESNGRKT